MFFSALPARRQRRREFRRTSPTNKTHSERPVRGAEGSSDGRGRHSGRLVGQRFYTSHTLDKCQDTNFHCRLLMRRHISGRFLIFAQTSYVMKASLSPSSLSLGGQSSVTSTVCSGLHQFFLLQHCQTWAFATSSVETLGAAAPAAAAAVAHLID